MGHHSRYDKKKEEGNFLNNLTNIYGKLMYGEVKTENEEILDSIKSAHEDWINAEKYFENATDPDLIDYSIYRIEAAKTRYTYLLKLAREMGVEGDFQ